MEPISRRAFLGLAASAGVAIATSPPSKLADRLIPYVNPPEYPPSGQWATYATTCRECPAGCGMHLWHRDGRVTKAEGNPEHPVNCGGLCARGQSSLQGLYDPDRLRAPQRSGGALASWPDAITSIGDKLRNRRGRVVVLSDLQTGALREVVESFAAAFGGAALFWEPINCEALCGAHDALFGLPQIPAFRMEQCRLILTFGADFLDTWISPVEYAAAFSRMHAFREGGMGRMVYVGPRLSMTAGNADDFLCVPPGGELAIAVEMLRAIAEKGRPKGDARTLTAHLKALSARAGGLPEGVSRARVESLARAFVESPSSVALAGPAGGSGSAARDLAMAAALLNYAAGRIGSSMDFAAPHALSRAAGNRQAEALLEGLTQEDILFLLGANPVYALNGAEAALRRAGAVVCLGTMPDESAALAHWTLPVDSPLESWGDYEPRAGVHGLMQPTLSRLHNSRPAGDLFLEVARAAGKPLARPGGAGAPENFEQWLHLCWRELHARLSPLTPFDLFWHDSLRRGGAYEKPAEVSVQLRPVADSMVERAVPARLVNDSRLGTAGSTTTDAELWVWPSVMLFDGRVANRGWLQEAPEPTTSITWGSWVELHPRKARALGLSDGDVVEISNERAAIELPLLVTEDVAENVAAVPLGQGHTALGRNATRRGANAFRLLGGVEGPTAFGPVKLRPAGRSAPPTSVAPTQDQYKRELLQWMPLARLRAMNPGDGNPVVLPLPEGFDPRRDLYQGRKYDQHRWAMVVDLHRCTGCGACGVACYAENNIAVMGEEQLRVGRELAWLKVVPYRKEGSRRLGWLPMLCQQCECAPCEPVCPVFASVHDGEGLNAQVYNRCIGTRYCSNNCPYKVRRFNWRNNEWPSPLERQLNPEVTVRCRGVMEKCTFCIQRIRNAEHVAKRARRPVKDGDILPACVQSCPTRALLFGDLLLSDSEVSRLTHNDPRRYHVLESLNAKPAITYLMRIEQDEPV